MTTPRPSALAARLRAAAVWTVVRERDVAYARTGHDEVLVVTCDSDGGLGPKPADTVAVDGGTLGRFATRVPLLELLAVGATPVLIVDALAVERHPTGDEIIAGVLAEAAAAGLGPEAVTGSTEDNVPTVATGVGVTVIGHCRIGDLRPGRSRAGAIVALLGEPLSAPADRFGPDDARILDVAALRAVLAAEVVDEVLPIGSGGIASELAQLTAATFAGVDQPDTPCQARCVVDTAGEVDLTRSGGPSTAAVLVLRPGATSEDLGALGVATGLRVRELGVLVAAD